MPLTKLDPTAALVVIDLQKEVTGLSTVHPVDEIVGRTAELARAFRERGLPVVLVNVPALLRAGLMLNAPSSPFLRIGPSLLRNWSSTPMITLLASNDGAHSSAHPCMRTCASAE